MTSSAVSIVGLLFLGVVVLFVVLLVVLLVVLIANAVGKRRGVGMALLTGFLALLLVPVLLVALSFDSRSQTVRGTESHEQTIRVEGVEHNSDQSVAASSPSVTIAGTPWSNAVEEYQDFQADVYPSIESAAEALGGRVGKRLAQADPADGGTPSIYVWRDSDGGNTTMPRGGLIVTRDVLESVAAGLRRQLDEPAYVSVERPASHDAVAVRAAIQEIHIEHRNNRWGRQTESRSGAIALRVDAPGGPFSVSTRFADAPWIMDRTAFASNFANGDWLVAFSDGTHAAHEEARQDAIDLAAATLLPMAQARISRLSASDQHHYQQKLQKDPNWLHRRIADELVSRDLVKDRFTQSFDRPYGTVWREAILIDASPKRVEAIARSLVRGIGAQVTRQRTTWFSFVALAGLVFGTYLFLNMATKGYYAWALRLAAVAGLVAAGFVVTHLM